MQVKNYSVFMGEDRIQSRHAAKKDAKQKRNGKAIDARGIAAATDPVAAKRAQAQKKAMKILGDAFAGESKIDDDMSERREKIKSLTQEIADRKQDIKGLEDAKAALLEQGADENSEEVRQLSEGISAYNKQVMDAENELTSENAVIRQTKIERLKSNPMGEARDQADAVMAAAGDEVCSSQRAGSTSTGNRKKRRKRPKQRKKRSRNRKQSWKRKKRTEKNRKS